MTKQEIIQEFIEKYNLSTLFREDEIHLFKMKKYTKGENIVNANDNISSIYFILNGGVDIYSFLSTGKSIFINKLSPSEIFGDVEYFGKIPMMFDVIANSDTVILTLSYKFLKNNMSKNSDFWRFLGKNATEKLLKTNRAILLKEGLNLKNILALKLVNNDHLITFNSLNELATELNVSYRNLTRVIKFFSDLGVIEKNKKSIKTINFHEIESYVEGI